MNSEWSSCKLSDVARIQGGYAFKGKDFSETGIPVIKIKNVRKRDIDLSDVVRVSDVIAEQASNFYIKSWDVLISMTGSGPNAPASIVGRIARHSGKDNEFLINQRVGRFLIKDTELLDQRFLYYLFSPQEMQLELLSIATGSANQVNISGKQIESVNLNLPPLTEQKTIAHILGSLDDKIELNRQMNETLEAMAQALFKSWFVDFDPVIDNALAAGNAIPDVFAERAAQRKAMNKDEAINPLFPDAFEYTEEMGWTPEGWAVSSLLNFIELIGGGTPKTTIEEYWNGDIPWFSVVDAPSTSDVFVIDTEKHVTELGVEKSSTKILRTGTTIISARGTVGKCAMVSKPMAMNQSCYGIVGKEGVSDTFVYYSVLVSVSALQQRGHGSVFNTITKDTFDSIKVTFGSGNLTVQFDEIVKPYFDKILSNSIEAETFSKLRDTLLPKLLSGELRIPDAEKLVEEATASKVGA